MLGKTNNTEGDKSVISSDMKIKGKISADGELVLLGSVVGDIKCHSLSKRMFNKREAGAGSSHSSRTATTVAGAIWNSQQALSSINRVKQR